MGKEIHNILPIVYIVIKDFICLNKWAYLYTEVLQWEKYYSSWQYKCNKIYYNTKLKLENKM